MQNSNLSSIIFPRLREDWLFFISKISHYLQELITNYNNDKQKVKDLESVIVKMREIRELSKDNPVLLLDHKGLFKFIDNSDDLEESFESLKFFKMQDNLDNPAVKDIYNKIMTSANIIELNSEYNSLSIKTSFDKERIKRLADLIRGNKVDYALIKELVNKYDLTDEQKKNILFYPTVMLSIKQNEIKDNKVNVTRKQEKIDYYHNEFNELTKAYYDIKDNFKDILIKCYNTKEQMSVHEIDTYNSYITNLDSINEYNNDIKYRIYTIAFFKKKKDIEDYIDGISDLIMDVNNLDSEIEFFQEMIEDFNNIATKLKTLAKKEKTVSNEFNNNVFFGLDAFNRLILRDELLDVNSIKEVFQKNNQTVHMLNVYEVEKLLGKEIFIIKTDNIMLAYIMVGNNTLVIADDVIESNKFEKIVNRIVEKNIVPLRKQIKMIENNELDYIDLQNRIVNSK